MRYEIRKLSVIVHSFGQSLFMIFNESRVCECKNKLVNRRAIRYLIFVLFSVQVFVGCRLLEALFILLLKALS
jgi:hypothetical protein